MKTQEYGQLISSRPARRIGPGRRSLTGRTIVRGRATPFESSLERDFLAILDFDRSVTSVQEQPCRIPYRDTLGRMRGYVPDFLVHYDGHPSVIYEIKHRDELRIEWHRLRPRFRAAMGYAMRNGMRFSIMTDQEIRGPHLRNVVFLRPYRDRGQDLATEEHLVRTLAILGETTPDALVESVYWTVENRIRAVSSLWRLIAIGRVSADLFAPLSMKTAIWVVPGEGFI
jgi:hypothetical protein